MNIKAIAFDVDGVVVNAPRFSDVYVKDYGIDVALMKPFFQGEFNSCKIGESDLKKALEDYLPKWQWQGGASEFVDYWLKSGDKVDQRMVSFITNLRNQGILCYLGTNQEKYRLNYLREKMNFSDYFDGIVCSAEVGFLKPADEFFDALFKKIQEKDSVLKREVLVVDDSEDIVSLADEYGFQSYLYEDFDKFKMYINMLKEIVY